MGKADDKLSKAIALFCENTLRDAKAEAIKEFAEKLREKIVNIPSDFPREIGTVSYINGSAHRQLEILDYLDNLAKEMTEE